MNSALSIQIRSAEPVTIPTRAAVSPCALRMRSIPLMVGTTEYQNLFSARRRAPGVIAGLAWAATRLRLRHTGNTFSAATGAGLKDLMAYKRHDRERAEVI
jgi:hypothetical protein